MINCSNSKHEDNGKKNKIVIPSREGTYSFSRKTYKEEILRNLITKFEYDKIIENASKIMGNALLTKRKNDHFEVSNWVIFLEILITCLVLFYLFALYASQDTSDLTLYYLSIIAICFALFVTSVQSIYNFCRPTRKYMTLEEIIKRDLDAHFEKINNTYYFSKVNDKYIYSGSLHFSYISGKKIIECYVEKPEEEAEYNASNEENNSRDKSINNYNNLRRNIRLQEKPKLEELQLGKDEEYDYQDSGKDSIIKEEDENGINSERQAMENKRGGNHFRVRSTVSIGNKAILIPPKELEIELNKTHSIKT